MNRCSLAFLLACKFSLIAASGIRKFQYQIFTVAGSFFWIHGIEMLTRICSNIEIAQFNLLLVLSGTFFDIINPDV